MTQSQSSNGQRRRRIVNGVCLACDHATDDCTCTMESASNWEQQQNGREEPEQPAPSVRLSLVPVWSMNVRASLVEALADMWDGTWVLDKTPQMRVVCPALLECYGISSDDHFSQRHIDGYMMWVRPS